MSGRNRAGEGPTGPAGAPGGDASRPMGPSAYDVERLLRGELPPAEAAAIQAALGRTGRAAELEELRASDREILERYPAPDVAREVARRAIASDGAGPLARTGQARGRTPRPWLLPLIGTTAMASALFIVLASRPGGSGTADRGDRQPPAQNLGQPRTNDPGEVIGLRGGEARLHIYRRAGAGVGAQTSSGAGAGAGPLPDGARVKPGEMLQLRYLAASAAFGLIFSIDARGQVSRHWPEGGDLAAPLQPSGERALPHAFELDDSPGFERFVFVTAPTAFEARPLIEALATGRPLPLGPGARATEITLIKDVP